MAKNLKALGEVFDYTCTGNVASGQLVVMNDTVGVAIKDGKAGDIVACRVEGVFELPKLASSDIGQGKKVYWDATNGQINLTASGNTYAGKAYAAAGSGTSTVLVSLNA